MLVYQKISINMGMFTTIWQQQWEYDQQRMNKLGFSGWQPAGDRYLRWALDGSPNWGVWKRGIPPRMKLNQKRLSSGLEYILACSIVAQSRQCHFRKCHWKWCLLIHECEWSSGRIVFFLNFTPGPTTATSSKCWAGSQTTPIFSWCWRNAWGVNCGS